MSALASELPSMKGAISVNVDVHVDPDEESSPLASRARRIVAASSSASTSSLHEPTSCELKFIWCNNNNNSSNSSNNGNHLDFSSSSSSTSLSSVLRNVHNEWINKGSTQPPIGHARKIYQAKGATGGGGEANRAANDDDLRLTKIIRRLHQETNSIAALELCHKLDLAVRSPLNMGYLTRSFDGVLDSLLPLYKQCPPPVLEECSKALGLMGYINRQSYPIYHEFILKHYRATKRMQRYLIIALYTTLSCDTKCELHIYSEKIMLTLKDFLENAESADSFMAISSTLVQFAHCYRQSFEMHFTDVVDIIIGWQLETGQPKQLKTHCAQVLEQLTPYFSKQMDFSYGLLAQFVEDITAGIEEKNDIYENGCVGSSSGCSERIGLFVGAFNSLLKCLARMQVFVGIPTCESIVATAVDHLTKSLAQSLVGNGPGSPSLAALVNINELLCICLMNGYRGLEPSILEEVIVVQFEQVHRLEDQQRQSLLYLLLCTVRKLRARLPPNLVQLIFQFRSEQCGQTYLAQIRLQTESIPYKLLLRTCQETLMVKNVPLLQQAYKHLVDDIDFCLQELSNPEHSLADTEDAALLLIFHLAALGALAKQTSSIIGMYACKPSILELLIRNCRADDLALWSRYPGTYEAILNLLATHCQANHNFRTTSSLLRDANIQNPEHTSPTAQSFETIIGFLARNLEHSLQLTQQNLKLLLRWTHSLLDECRERASTLLEQPDFMSICRSVAQIASKWGHLEAAACIQSVLSYGLTSQQDPLLLLYRDAALQQIKWILASNQLPVYAQIYAQLPLHVTLFAGGVPSPRICLWQQKISQCSSVRDTVFREFFEHLQQSDHQQLNQSLRELFVRSCQISAMDERQEMLSHCIRRCQRLAAAWMQFEAARYCVDQKLRTTLGKPQDTFLGFEAIIMRHARLLSGCAKEAERINLHGLSLMQLSNMQMNLNMLLGFLDALEKLIYNAAEGTAFALRAPEKPVSAFFRLNNPTCQSWFNRIRIGVVIIAMHSQQPELVIRYAQQILVTQNPQDCSFSQAIVYLAWAWICCQEADSLRGLYFWARCKVSGKTFQWLHCAADQAAGRKETALAGYSQILAEDDAELEPHTRQFVIAQKMQCLQDLGRWSRLVELKQKHLNRPEDSELNPFLQRSNVEVSALEKLLAKSEELSSNSEELNGAMQQLSLWPKNWDRGAGSKRHASCSSRHVRQELENLVLKKMLRFEQKEYEMQPLLDMHWRESLLNPSCDPQPSQEMILLKHIAQQMESQQQQQQMDLGMLPSPDCKRSSSISSSILIRCMAWTQLLRRHCNSSGGSWAALCLAAATAARKEGNPQTCQHLLEQYFGQSLEDMAKQLPLSLEPLDTENEQLMLGYSELAKCLQMQGNDPNASINVCSSLCLRIQMSSSAATETASCIASGLLLTLSDWISARSCSGLATNLSPTLQQLVKQLPECPLTKNTSTLQPPLSIPQGERLVARLIHASLVQKPNSEEALIAYGNWCYRWGKKIVDSGCVLTQADMTAIGQACGGSLPLDGERMAELVQILSMEAGGGLGVGCEIEVCPETGRIRDDEAAKVCLRQLSVLTDKPNSVLDEILMIWRRAIANTYDYYKNAAKSYFHYLSVKAGTATTTSASCNATSSDCPGSQTKRFQVDDSNMVTTTLRLLRLIVKHASGLQDVLEQGLRTTPIAPWKVIIPQLFSRLNHHEVYVRKSVCDLLCRLAESHPQLVIFPAVVGANREVPKEKSANSREATAVTTSTALPNLKEDCCYGYLIGALHQQFPEEVQHVQLLVKELRRVCLLWDEYWIHSLVRIYNSYVCKVNALATEFKPDDHEGKNNCFNSLRPQILADLEAVVAFTSRPAETSYERSFKRSFDGPIKATLEAVRGQRYPDAWEKLKHLYHIIQANMIRGTSNTLKMQSLSPVLCELGGRRICMPGLDGGEAVHIESVEGTVCVLPTKTKPKKVAFYGSNGQRYTYLFKGLEDLHLDERIMQFLSISNAIMACRSDAPTNSIGGSYRAHHYSVIPLGPQSGLISWVDGVTPLFALYKKWQQRRIQSLKNSPNATSRRFTDLFYSKLAPLMAKHNIVITDPRRQWPIAALRQVLAELSKETPNDLLSRELWCQSGNAAEWRQSVRKYTMCMSVMSMIGYVIGLGDRHLDNVLINISSGDIVHIDYNVCFEKGRTLRIPEKVPFRLTQNLVNALGVTGIEGAFRLGCEYVLKVMRKERETLLTLLEAFVYDPLVDWTVSDRGGVMLNAKQGQQHDMIMIKGHKKDKTSKATKPHDWEAKRQHFVGKLNQLQKFWSQYKVDMLAQVTEMTNEIANLQVAQSKHLASEHELQELNQRSALINEIQSLGSAIESHSFNSASMRYKVTRRNTEMLAKHSNQRQSDYAMVKCLLDSYNRCVKQQHLSDLSVQLIQFKLEGSNWHSEYVALAEVLQMHLPAQILASYEATRNEIDGLMHCINDLSLQSVEHLTQYAAVMEYFPEQQFKENNIFVRFHDCFTEYIRGEGGSSSSSVASTTTATHYRDPSNALATAEILENVWNYLRYQLEKATQRYIDKQGDSVLMSSKSSMILRLIDQSGLSQELLKATVCRTLDCTSMGFNSYASSAMISQTEDLLLHQLRYIHVVRSMCQGVLIESEQSQIALAQLVELENLLAVLTQLKQSFERDLPACIYKYLLINTNWQLLTRLTHLGSNDVAFLYNNAVKMPSSGALTIEQKFLRTLQPAYEQFQMLAKSLGKIVRSIKLMLDDMQVEQHLELDIFKNQSSGTLSDSCFFDCVLQTLEISRSFDLRQMALPIGSLVQRLQDEYLASTLPLLAYSYYSSCGPRCQTMLAEEEASPDALSKAEQLCDGLFLALQMETSMQQLQADINQYNQQIELQTLIASAHHWAYDLQIGQIRFAHVISREKLCSAIFKNWQELERHLANVQRLQMNLESQLMQLQNQRSNWNRNHIDSLLRNEQMQRQSAAAHLGVVSQVMLDSSTVCRLEHVAEKDDDQLLLGHLEQWLQCFNQWQSSSSRLSPVEQALVQLLDPEGSIDQCWLQNVQGLLEEHTCKLQREIAALECEQQTKHQFICTLLKETQRLQDPMPRIHVRSLCSEAQTQGQGKLIPQDVQLLCGHVRDCQRKLQNFFQRLMDLRKDLCGERRMPLQPAVLEGWQQQLLQIKNAANQEIDEYFKSVEEFLQNASEVHSLPYENFAHNKGAANLHEQKRNAYGVSVWKKIRMKLEGRDPDGNQRSTVAEQVDYAIREATNPDNLAVLYEGWTPWV
ncbi:serine/threonine-protein kinase Smg1 [Drosophila tropicalis]|uniref:serine/threonine-protein kinase Smg1 n=1 Tax=Drosophila tropicalis TaxID=46794 RepID=UPI0035AC0614